MSDQLAYVYVDERSISPSLFCPICLEVLQEPYTHTICDSAFCRSCLLQLVEPLCPICRWTWEEEIPLDENIFLPRANRLIRNMLDDLRVRCIDCQTIRRRGQFEHQCDLSDQQISESKYLQSSKSVSFENLRTIFLFIFLFILWLTIAYYNRDTLLVRTIDRPSNTIQDVATNLDQYLLGKLYSLIVNVLQYSQIVFTIGLIIWCTIKFFAERYFSKTISRLLESVFETFVIVNLIINSIVQMQ